MGKLPSSLWVAVLIGSVSRQKIVGYSGRLGIFCQSVMRRCGTPHEPTVIGRIASFDAKKASATGRSVHPPARHGWLHQDWLTDRHIPQDVPGCRGEANHSAVKRAQE
jgi:hypothetical protein